jgi:hypothetical protein
MTIESITVKPITDEMVEIAARAVLQRKYPMTRAEDMWLDPVVIKDARIALEAALSHSPVEQTAARETNELGFTAEEWDRQMSEPYLPRGKQTPDLIEHLAKSLAVFTKHYDRWMDKWSPEEQCACFSRHTYGDLRKARELVKEADSLVSTPIAHTFHIDPVSRESVRDEVEGTPPPAAHLPLREQDRLNGEAGVRKINELLDGPAPQDHLRGKEAAIRKAGQVAIGHLIDTGLTFEASGDDLADYLTRIVDACVRAALAAEGQAE